jgi:phosphatidylglycerol:prolipoprotein diacylglycerol transferase
MLNLFAPPRHYILIVAALWIGLALAEKSTSGAERHGISKDALNNLTFYSLFAYILGGRLLYAIANISSFAKSPLSLFSPNPDLFDPTFAFVAMILFGLIYSQKQGFPVWNTLDAITPIFATLAIGLHLAHFAAGTAFGSPTDLPWGINQWNAVRHPTQIYELIASLIIFGLIWFRKRDSSSGILFLHFTVLTATARLFLEAFRGDSELILGGFRFAQIAAWVVLAVVLFTSASIQQDTKLADTRDIS